MRQWTPIVEALPELHKTVIVELTANEYLGRNSDKVIAARLYRCPYTLDLYWFYLGDCPVFDWTFVSSTDIWAELPISSCESLNYYYYQEKNNG